MPLPPSTVTLKRRRDDDPVQFLRVHESSSKSKRRLTTDFVFSRQIEPLESIPTSTSSSPPSQEHDQPRRIKPLPRSASSQVIEAHAESRSQTQEAPSGINEHSNDDQPTLAHTTLLPSSQNDTPITPQSKKQQPRRFHLSRSASTTPSSVISGRVQKLPALFVERRTRARATLTGTSQTSTPAFNSEPAKVQAPPLKKPGQAARTTAPASRATQLASQSREVRLSSGLIAPWSLDDEQLVEEMQRYTLQEIGYNIAQAEAPEPGRSPVPTPNKKPSKFKPKVPKLRYHERHPEKFADQDSQMEIEEFVEDLDDDSDYIIETYVRVPADAMELDTNAETNFGFLVLDGQEDIDEFYSAEIDSDEDEDCDEEDENAENHYSADYPDEEVDSDDEYGRNPYQYTNNDDEGFSDESDGGIKYQWAKKPAWLKKADRGSDDDE